MLKIQSCEQKRKHVVPFICIHVCNLQNAKANRKAQNVQCWEKENNQQEICLMFII